MQSYLPLCLALVLVAAPALAATPRTETREYVGGGSEVNLGVCALGATVVGGGCFAREAGDSVITVTLEDKAGYPVAGTIRYRNAQNAVIASIPFCETWTTRIPPEAVRVSVFLETPLGPIDCPTSPAIPTTGTITATFS